MIPKTLQGNNDNHSDQVPLCSSEPHTTHGAIQHSCELIALNDGEGLEPYCEEGLEANNKDVRKYLLIARTSSGILQIQDVHNRLLERSDRKVLDSASKFSSKRKNKNTQDLSNSSIDEFFKDK